jgi:hypothetical protein
MADASNTVDCAEHGKRTATFVCQHLAQGEGLGFRYAFNPENPNQLFPDAWCDACDEIYERTGGWDEDSEKRAGITPLCADCYQRVRLLNWPRDTQAAFEQLLEHAVVYIQAQQDVLRDRYRLNDHERYDWDQGTGQLVFSSKGSPALTAEIQFVGSVSTHSGTWLWSWANEAIDEPVKRRIREVKAYGDTHRLLRLAAAYWHASEEDG